MYIKQPTITNIVGFKVGMAHIGMTDDTESPSKNLEVSRACTLVEIPKTQIYGARFYGKDETSRYKKTIAESAPHEKEALGKFRQRLGEFSDITALLVANVKDTSTGQHHHVRYESSLGGAKIEDKFEFMVSNLSKQLGPTEVFKPGEYIDVASVTTGKGWQGTIKRFGTARLYHKATQKTRHVGTLGPFTPGKVLFTVPQAGQTGFNYRTEYNKRILKIGSKNDTGAMTPKSGFKNYGIMNNDFVVLDGSVPGPSRRLVRLRKSVTDRNHGAVKEPKLLYASMAT